MKEYDKMHVQQALGDRPLTPAIEAAYDTYALYKAGLSLGEVSVGDIPNILLAVEGPFGQVPGEPAVDAKGAGEPTTSTPGAKSGGKIPPAMKH
jgi:hypothetical protein